MATPDDDLLAPQQERAAAATQAPQTSYYDDFDFGPGDFDLPPPDLTKYVTVLHGYGRRRPNERHFLDQYEGLGGVIKNVPEATAKKWQALPSFRVHILPHDATEVDYAKAAGIRPMAAKKLAAILGASDIDELVSALGAEKTQRIIEALQRRMIAAQVREAGQGSVSPRARAHKTAE